MGSTRSIQVLRPADSSARQNEERAIQGRAIQGGLRSDSTVAGRERDAESPSSTTSPVPARLGATFRRVRNHGPGETALSSAMPETVTVSPASQPMKSQRRQSIQGERGLRKGPRRAGQGDRRDEVLD